MRKQIFKSFFPILLKLIILVGFSIAVCFQKILTFIFVKGKFRYNVKLAPFTSDEKLRKKILHKNVIVLISKVFLPSNYLLVFMKIFLLEKIHREL